MKIRRRKPRLSRLQLLLALLVVVLLCCYVVMSIFLRSLTSPVTKVDTPRVEFVVKKGETTIAIANNLYAVGLIRSPLGFRYEVKRNSLGSKLQAGTYYLTPTATTLEIASSLTRGIADVKLTIPEGYRLEEIAATLESELGLSASDFLLATKGLEGYLFPDTYYLAPSSSVDMVVQAMQANFAKKVGKIDQRTLILASLIERETAGNAEKPIVAGILEKRLSAGWALELDATVQYALGRVGEWWPNTTLADRKASSPYNTYLNTGLPPTPICNPGLASIEAARSPVASDYWFYLHGRDGQIHYGRDLTEHNQNIAKYIR